jgi:hypothetical protein
MSRRAGEEEHERESPSSPKATAGQAGERAMGRRTKSDRVGDFALGI